MHLGGDVWKTSRCGSAAEHWRITATYGFEPANHPYSRRTLAALVKVCTVFLFVRHWFVQEGSSVIRPADLISSRRRQTIVSPGTDPVTGDRQHSQRDMFELGGLVQLWVEGPLACSRRAGGLSPIFFPGALKASVSLPCTKLAKSGEGPPARLLHAGGLGPRSGMYLSDEHNETCHSGRRRRSRFS